MNHSIVSRRGFTLTELLIALGVGLIVLNAAFVVFVNTGKFFKRIESVGAKAEVTQDVLLWALTKDTNTNPFDSTFPKLERQFRRVGVSSITVEGNYYVVIVDEVPATPPIPEKPVLQPVHILIPMCRK